MTIQNFYVIRCNDFL